MFVEVLEKMQQKMDRMEEQQKQLVAPTPEEPEIDASESPSQEEESEPEAVMPKKIREVYGPGSGTNKRTNLGEVNVT